MATIVSALREAGYDVTHEVISARCLTAQTRKRLFIVGVRRRSGQPADAEAETAFQFPFIPDLRLCASDILQPEPEIERAGRGLADYTISDAQMERLLHETPAWKPSKLAWDDVVCQTLTSHYAVSIARGESQLVPRSPPHNPRRFTHREAARLMGFPDTYHLRPAGGPGQPEAGEPVGGWFNGLYQMLGNAVCPPVVAALGGAIVGHALGGGVGQGRREAQELALACLPGARAAAVRGRLGLVPGADGGGEGEAADQQRWKQQKTGGA